jgi:hypothetical protein
MATGIRCCYEEHGAALNERTVLVGKRRANGYLLQAVSQWPRFTGVLKLPHPIVIHRIVSHQSSLWSPWPKPDEE